MAQTSPLAFDLSAPEPSRLPVYRRLALLNGLALGLAAGLGAWAPEVLRVVGLSVPLYLPLLGLGLAAAVALGGLVGWLSGRLANAVLTTLLWLAAAVGLVLLMGYLPFRGRTLVAWLADPRFRGLEVYPDTLGGNNSGLVLGGLLLILVLGVLGLLQGYRLENLVSSLGGGRSPGGRGWLALLWPTVPVFAAAAITQSMMVNPSATALQLTRQAIETGRTYGGDDFLEMGTVGGINYAALRGLEGRLGGDYALNLAEVNAETASVVTSVRFAGGDWFYCLVINDQLSYCYDAAPAYINTLRSLVEGRPLPEPCRGCDVGAPAAWGGWWAERRGRVGPSPTIELLAQQGNQTIFRIAAPDAPSAIECRFEGVGPVRLAECWETDDR